MSTTPTTLRVRVANATTNENRYVDPGGQTVVQVQRGATLNTLPTSDATAPVASVSLHNLPTDLAAQFALGATFDLTLAPASDPA